MAEHEHTTDELTETEKQIAADLAHGFDMISRLLNGPISHEYFHGKFPAALRAFLRVAERTGIDPDKPGQMHVRDDAPDWDVHKVWDQVVRSEAGAGGRLDQIWTALQYDNPYYVAELGLLSNGKPYFAHRPETLDDPASTEWHVQYETEDAPRMTRATVRGRSAADAVRNAYYVFPQATSVRINKLEHPDAP